MRAATRPQGITAATCGDGQNHRDHGANNLVADLTAFSREAAKNSVSAVPADISALAHGAGVHATVANVVRRSVDGRWSRRRSRVAELGAASADSGHADPAPVIQHATLNICGNHV